MIQSLLPACGSRSANLKKQRTEAIPALTAIDDSASLQVNSNMRNPYPRWTINPLAVLAGGRTCGSTPSKTTNRLPAKRY